MSRNTTITTEITVEYDAVDADGEHEPAVESEDVSVAWQFSHLDPGRYSGPPENCYPAEGGEVLRCIVTRADGSAIADGESWLRTALGEAQFEDECERALQASIERLEGRREDADEWKWEEARDYAEWEKQR
jgi:hypothetical protein